MKRVLTPLLLIKHCFIYFPLAPLRSSFFPRVPATDLPPRRVLQSRERLGLMNAAVAHGGVGGPRELVLLRPGVPVSDGQWTQPLCDRRRLS